MGQAQAWPCFLNSDPGEPLPPNIEPGGVGATAPPPPPQSKLGKCGLLVIFDGVLLYLYRALSRGCALAPALAFAPASALAVVPAFAHALALTPALAFALAATVLFGYFEPRNPPPNSE